MPCTFTTGLRLHNGRTIRSGRSIIQVFIPSQRQNTPPLMPKYFSCYITILLPSGTMNGIVYLQDTGLLPRYEVSLNSDLYQPRGSNTRGYHRIYYLCENGLGGISLSNALEYSASAWPHEQCLHTISSMGRHRAKMSFRLCVRPHIFLMFYLFLTRSRHPDRGPGTVQYSEGRVAREERASGSHINGQSGTMCRPGRRAVARCLHRASDWG